MHMLTTCSATVNLSRVYSGFNSTSLLFGTGCVDGSGSLSGGAFNQLKLVTLSIVIPLLNYNSSTLVFVTMCQLFIQVLRNLLYVLRHLVLCRVC